MNDDFATAMRRSLDLTRSGNLADATRQIQEALGGNAAPLSPKPAAEPAAKRWSLGETVKDLKARTAFRTANMGTPRGAAPVADGAQFETRQYSGAGGSRAYRLYVPSCAREDLRGLVVMLHGCTQTPEDFAAGTTMNAKAEEHKMLVAYPEQTRGHNANMCWNWFEPGHQSAGAGEPAILAGIAAEIAQEFALPKGRTFAAGLSAGGAMAAILGATHPEVFSAVGVHSGLAPQAARDVMTAFSAMRGDGPVHGKALMGPAIIFQGLSDSTVAPVNASRLAGTIIDAERSSAMAEGRKVQKTVGETADGAPVELWLIEGAGHAWSGGSPTGSYADAAGPDASAEMMRFFNAQMDV